MCDEYTLEWPLLFTSLYNHVPSSVDGICDLLLTKRTGKGDGIEHSPLPWLGFLYGRVGGVSLPSSLHCVQLA